MCLPYLSSLFKKISPKTFGPHCVCAPQLNALLCVRIESWVHVIYTGCDFVDIVYPVHLFACINHLLPFCKFPHHTSLCYHTCLMNILLHHIKQLRRWLNTSISLAY
jgi:hypothetical protein